MKQEFRGKTIYFFGDSNTCRGGYLYWLRSFLRKSKEKCYVFNRALGGWRAEMAQYAMENEISDKKPDYIFLSFGVNDLGIWLYDSLKPVTEEVLAKRKLRDTTFITCLEKIVDYFTAQGIKVILSSPFAVDEYLTEREDIETIADNKEKEDYIGPSFYKRATFRNINAAVKNYGKQVKALAERKGLLFVDTFEASYKIMQENRDMFLADGVHYVDNGQAFNAKCILEFLGFDNVSLDFEKDAQNDLIFEKEQEERFIQFYPYNVYNPVFAPNRTDEEVKAWVREIANSPNSSVQERENAVKHLALADKQEEMRAELHALIHDYIDGK